MEALARKLYEARHPPSEGWHTWSDLDQFKTYKKTKYRQLAEVAVNFFEG